MRSAEGDTVVPGPFGTLDGAGYFRELREIGSVTARSYASTHSESSDATSGGRDTGLGMEDGIEDGMEGFAFDKEEETGCRCPDAADVNLETRLFSVTR